MRSYCLILVFLMLSSCSQRTIGGVTPRPGFELTLQAAEDQGGKPESSELEAAVSTAADSILAAVNIRRALAGIPPLIKLPGLAGIASRRSEAMVMGGYLGHVDPQSGEVVVELLLQQSGFSEQAAELIYNSHGALSTLADEAIQAWFIDPDHQLILLSPEFRYSGIGIMGDGQVWVITAILTGDLP